MERLDTLLVLCGMRLKRPSHLYYGLVLLTWNCYRFVVSFLFVIGNIDTPDLSSPSALMFLFHGLLVCVS
jgi:hypothetical protein